MTGLLLILGLLGIYAAAAALLRFKPQPAWIHGPASRTYSVAAADIELFFDTTWMEENRLRSQLCIAEQICTDIRSASHAVLDVFLFDLPAEEGAPTRPLTKQIADAVRNSDCAFTLIADPANTAYGTDENPPFTWLLRAGARVIEVDVQRLRHSTLVYAPLYEAVKHVLPKNMAHKHPFRRAGKASPYAIATALTARGDHRKVLVSRAERCSALVSSSNLHDASAYFENVALRVRSCAVARHLLAAEKATARMSGGCIDWDCPGCNEPVTGSKDATATPLMGSAIKQSILADLRACRAEDVVFVGMLFLSSGECIAELVRAHRRGAQVHVVLDDGTESFGKNAGRFPNGVVASELLSGAPAMDVRFRRTSTEYHCKYVHIEKPDQCIIHAGSANLTRRGLIGTNLETNLRVTLPKECDAARKARAYRQRMLSSQCSLSAERETGFKARLRWLAYRSGEPLGVINC